VAPYGDTPAPSGYVPGLGRGAAGFTTRSDIGPGQAPIGETRTLGGGDDENDDSNAAPTAADDNAALFGRDTATYDDDDAEADEIWASIDARMDGRRKEARESKEKEALEKFRSENPSVVEQFKDLKRELKDVSYAEWDAIPDIGDYSIKRKKLNAEFAPPPDTLLARALAEKETTNTASEAGGTGGTGDGGIGGFDGGG
jgi:pre-mRNA-processing factor 6